MILNPIICEVCKNKLQPSKIGVDVIDGKLMRVCGFCGHKERVE